MIFKMVTPLRAENCSGKKSQRNAVCKLWHFNSKMQNDNHLLTARCYTSIKLYELLLLCAFVLCHWSPMDARISPCFLTQRKKNIKLFNSRTTRHRSCAVFHLPALSRCALEAPHLAGVSPQSPAAVQGQSHRLPPHRVPLRQDGGLQPRAPLHRRTAHVQHARNQQGAAERLSVCLFLVLFLSQ